MRKINKILSFMFLASTTKLFLSQGVILILLSLEVLMMSIFSMMILSKGVMYSMSMNLIFFIFIVVCEGALGLCIFISMIRYSGNDKLKSLGLLK